MIEGIYQTELRRVFLTEDLPKPLTRASSHLQIFDNYIKNTRLRLRSMRSPETKEWIFVLQQRFPVSKDLSVWRIAEIHLNGAEHAAFEMFENREIRKNQRIETNEIRKNRYFHEFGGKQFAFDVFLGSLWGLNMAKIVFKSAAEMQKFEIPPFAVREITNNHFFTGENLVGKNFADFQAEFDRLVKF
ncbi:MAG: hypothetical protein H0W58_12890 [Acidobacteria bacterium]|jgi:hypothetical protein|nr:hypothetical protein [Acidobacteriota bacterium]